MVTNDAVHYEVIDLCKVILKGKHHTKGVAICIV